MGFLYSNNVVVLTPGPFAGATTTESWTVTSANATQGAIYQDAAFNQYKVSTTIASQTTLTTTGTTDAAGNAFVFTVSSANATIGATYTDASSNTYTVTTTISGGTTLTTNRTTVGTAGPASGTLTIASGTGDTTITYSAKANSTASTALTKVSGTGDAVINFSAQIDTGITYQPNFRAHVNSIKLISGSGAASQLTLTAVHSGDLLYQANAATSGGVNYDHGLNIHSAHGGWTYTLTGAGSTAYIYLREE